MQSTDPSAAPSAPPPGWYPDPWQVAPTRWWDGIAWTGFTTPPRPAVLNPVPVPVLGIPPGNPQKEFGIGARHDVRGGGVAVLGFVAAIALSLIGSKLASLFGARTLTVPNLVLSQLGLWTGLCVAAYVATHRRVGGTIADLGFRSPSGKEIGIGIAAGIGAIFWASRVEFVLRSAFPDNGSPHLFVSGTPSYSLVLVVGVLACFGAPIVEELFFRGLVQTVLMRNLGTAPAVIVQAVLFGLAHFQPGMTFDQAAVRCGTVMVLGVINGGLRVHTGRLSMGIVAHATYNTIVTVIMLVAIAGAVH